MTESCLLRCGYNYYVHNYGIIVIIKQNTGAHTNAPYSSSPVPRTDRILSLMCSDVESIAQAKPQISRDIQPRLPTPAPLCCPSPSRATTAQPVVPIPASTLACCYSGQLRGQNPPPFSIHALRHCATVNGLLDFGTKWPWLERLRVSLQVRGICSLGFRRVFCPLLRPQCSRELNGTSISACCNSLLLLGKRH